MFNKYIINTFLSAIKNNGENNALCINDKFYTYVDLSKYISKIRYSLQVSGNKSINVGLVANDDIETYASIFAIWLEGLAYVPLLPHKSLERSLEIIAQADINLILNSNNEKYFPSTKTIESSHLEFTELLLQPKPTSDDSLAYILFTSGSTGKPKGVQITRKNVGAFMRSFWETGILINEHDRCLQCFDLTFDVSVQSYLTPLTKGACTYTIPHDQIKYSYVYGLLEDHHLTFCVVAPSMLRYLRPYFDELNIHSVKYCILTAEASPIDLIKEWSICIPNAKIFDFYGPTEATIYCTYYEFKRNSINKQLNGMLSIGKPLPNLNAIVIDEGNNILDTNQKGELCISGDQLALGYWKNPDKNKNSFIEILVNGSPTRFYKTGDSCYFDDEGDIMLFGRLDYQVKIQGYRIELGEIEFHSREFLNGKNAIAVTFNNEMGNDELALFIESESTKINELQKYLKSKMPYYMVPTKTIKIKHFPLNQNGKVDRNILKTLII